VKNEHICEPGSMLHRQTENKEKERSGRWKKEIGRGGSLIQSKSTCIFKHSTYKVENNRILMSIIYINKCTKTT
jgi:hypothetical protein